MRRAISRIIEDHEWSTESLMSGGDREESKAFLGPYLSGNKLIDRENYQTKLIEMAQPQMPIGGDMETRRLADN